MALTAGDSFINNIYLSLMVDRGTFFQDPEFGSRLYLLKRAKSLEGNARLAKDYCEEALAWMIEAGRAKSFEIETEIEKLSGTDRLNIRILAVKANGQAVEFTTFTEIV
jgi:phage gp46-like protein